MDEPITDYCTITEVVATHTDGDLAGMTTYRVYVQTLHPTDFLTSVSGNVNIPLDISTTTTFYQNLLGSCFFLAPLARLALPDPGSCVGGS